MEILVEAVLLDNFCMDVFIGYSATLLTKRAPNYPRIFLSALLGSGFALLSPLVTRFEIAFKLAVLFLCTAVLSGKSTLKGYLILTFVYACLTFAFAGILSFFLGGRLSVTFIGISKGFVVAVISASCFFFAYAVRQVSGLIKEGKRKDRFARVELIFGETRFDLPALFDSGNLLTDQSGADVILVDEKAISSGVSPPSVGSMLVRTASGSKVLPLVKIPEIKIYSAEGENKLINVTAALSDLPQEYSVILPYK